MQTNIFLFTLDTHIIKTSLTNFLRRFPADIPKIALLADSYIDTYVNRSSLDCRNFVEAISHPYGYHCVTFYNQTWDAITRCYPDLGTHTVGLTEFLLKLDTNLIRCPVVLFEWQRSNGQSVTRNFGLTFDFNVNIHQT